MKKNAPHSQLYNNELDKIKTTVIDVLLSKEIDWFSTTGKSFKTYLFRKVRPAEYEYKSKSNKTNLSFLQHFDSYIKYRINEETKIKKQSTKPVVTVYNHLKQFVKETRYHLTFTNIDKHFVNKYLKYLAKHSIRDSTAKKHLSIIKTFMKSLEDHHDNGDYSDVLTINTTKDNVIALTLEEITKIRNYEPKSLRLQRCKDVFLMQCFTGLRYSDVKKITMSMIDFDQNIIKLHQTKTGQSTVVPLLDPAKEIIIKHDGKLPVISNQKYNEAIKELCKAAGISNKITRTKYISGEEFTEEYEKWQVISSHTGRKSFITVCLSLGISHIEVMKLSGHKSFTAFQQYIGLQDEVIANNVGNKLNALYGSDNS